MIFNGIIRLLRLNPVVIFSPGNLAFQVL